MKKITPYLLIVLVSLLITLGLQLERNQYNNIETFNEIVNIYNKTLDDFSSGNQSFFANPSLILKRMQDLAVSETEIIQYNSYLSKWNIDELNNMDVFKKEY